jgi:hypothetical protein
MEPNCQFCLDISDELRPSGQKRYDTLKASAGKGCNACCCLLEVVDYSNEEDSNVYAIQLNTFRPFKNPYIRSQHTPNRPREMQECLHIDVFTECEETGDENMIR